MKCDCIHMEQDKLNGNKNRVHNPTMKDRKLSGYRCTVCGKLKTIKQSEEITKEK